MVIITESNASNLINEEDEEEPGEVIESAPPLKVGEERTLGSSGIKKKLLKCGSGFQLPDFGDEVTIKFVGCLLDGTRFAESDDRNYKVGSGEMVSGLDRGIVTMKKGEKAIFTLPPELAYGEAGRDGVPPNSYIKFKVELISWITVIDVSKDGGVIKRVVVKGEQTGKPCDLDEVLVKYVVTLADGTLLARTPEEGVEFYVNDGHLCPALPKAIKTMNRGDMVNLEVQPKCMDGLPSGWGLEMGVVPAVKTGKHVRARLHKKDTKKPQTEAKRPQMVIDLEKNKDRKRKEIPDAVTTLEDASSKKIKPCSFSLVSVALSPLAIPYVSDDDVMKWRNRDPIRENEAIIKASSEILVSALQRQSILQEDGTRLNTLEREKYMLSKKVEDRDKVISKLKDNLQQKKDYYESELKTQEEVANGLSATIDNLKEENRKLKEQAAELTKDQQNGWAKEKKKVEGASFKTGFRNYASGFLAQDPDYDFSKFGEETVQWITKFKIDEAAEIKAKRVFLGLEEASPVPDEEEDASSEGASPEKETVVPKEQESNPSKADNTSKGTPPPIDKA